MSRAIGWTVVLSTVLLCASLAGCGSNADSPGDATLDEASNSLGSTSASTSTTGSSMGGFGTTDGLTTTSSLGGASSSTGGGGMPGMASTMGGSGGATSTPTTNGAATTLGATSGAAGGSGGREGAGGSGGSLSDPDVPETEHCAPAAAWDPGFAEFELEVLAIVNENREAGWDCGSEGQFAPASPLAMDPALRCAARLHSKDMNDRDFTDHVNPDGLAPNDRMQAAGYAGFTWGENIAWGQNTPAEVVDWWMNSDAHCANIMSPDFTLIGVGYFSGDGQWGDYWTQTFGSN